MLGCSLWLDLITSKHRIRKRLFTKDVFLGRGVRGIMSKSLFGRIVDE
jgi:hypothetical protein